MPDGCVRSKEFIRAEREAFRRHIEAHRVGMCLRSGGTVSFRQAQRDLGHNKIMKFAEEYRKGFCRRCTADCEVRV